MLRIVLVVATALGLAACAPPDRLGAAGEVDRFVRGEEAADAAPPARDPRAVRCACDAEGGLHVRAPGGSQVAIPEDASFPAEAEVVIPDGYAEGPVRRTKSLGFIGDNPLTPSP